MDRELFLKKAKKIIEENNELNFKKFNSFANDASNKILSDVSYYKQIGSDLLRDFDFLVQEGYESTAWFAKKDNVEGDTVITKEIRKIMQESNNFFNLTDASDVGSYLVSLKTLNSRTGDLVSMHRMIKLDGTIINTIEDYEFSCAFDNNEEVVSFKYYVKEMKSSYLAPQLNDLAKEMMSSLGLSEKWELDYFSLQQEKDYILLKKDYRHNGSDLTLSITKEKGKEQVLKFVSRDEKIEKSINAMFSNHDLTELNDASDVIDLNCKY